MERLKRLREKFGMSQAELADKAGISQPFIGAIESGRKSPTLRTLEKLANAMDISVLELLGAVGEPSAKVASE
ncbi:helix-turn-helix domain-containing protein [Desulforamulus reducens]|uniref:helix-turn-helix domain-containing protein n=1 Tax=Desulforamulus reducens TaxID=59610 RepID=UPI0002E520DE|nr:helix-turn-helix transcriptional regulator [Desulforamulus reducens]